MTTKYRKAFIAVQSGHDFRPLLDLCEQLVFCTTGYEGEEELEHSMRAAMHDFIPEKDLIVPVGNVTVSCILGAVAAEHQTKVNLAMYVGRNRSHAEDPDQEKHYKVQPIWIGAKNE